VYRAVDQDGQVIDVLVSVRRDADAARRFFRRALKTLKVTPVEVVTDAAAVLCMPKITSMQVSRHVMVLALVGAFTGDSASR
jgi:transposase-like protein